ncbi:MAG TPA: MTH1187 family thiamine-binding protein [Egibacteraceae bacterium]|nr:MTH1187 family thiamine-binding protein [Egibacteraceae bacterium]
MLVWFSVTPIGTGSASVSAEVARAVRAVAATGIRHETDASGTLLEGDWDACMAALRAAGEAVLSTAPRVSFTCKFDLRTDKPDQRGSDKLASLHAHLQGDQEHGIDSAAP